MLDDSAALRHVASRSRSALLSMRWARFRWCSEAGGNRPADPATLRRTPETLGATTAGSRPRVLCNPGCCEPTGAAGSEGMQRRFLWVCCVMVGVETAPPIRRAPPSHDGPSTRHTRIGWWFRPEARTSTERRSDEPRVQNRPLSATPSMPSSAATWDESRCPARSR